MAKILAASSGLQSLETTQKRKILQCFCQWRKRMCIESNYKAVCVVMLEPCSPCSFSYLFNAAGVRIVSWVFWASTVVSPVALMSILHQTVLWAESFSSSGAGWQPGLVGYAVSFFWLVFHRIQRKRTASSAAWKSPSGIAPWFSEQSTEWVVVVVQWMLMHGAVCIEVFIPRRRNGFSLQQLQVSPLRTAFPPSLWITLLLGVSVASLVRRLPVCT